MEFWTPLVVRLFEGRVGGSVTIHGAFAGIGRLRPGVSLEQATAEVRTLLARAASDRPLPPGMEFETRVASLREEQGRPFRPALLALNLATGLVLLMACANVAGLLLGRGVVRRRELAVRSALGAGRGRIVRQLLTESVILSSAGGAAGLGLAAGLVRAAPALAPQTAPVPGLGEVGLDATGLAFVAGLSVAAGLFFGTAPALACSRMDLARTLNDGSAAPAGGFGRLRGNRIQSVLAVGQMALAIVFLTGAGLLLRSFVSLATFDLGFDPTNVVMARTDDPALIGMFQRGTRIGPDEIEAMDATARRRVETLVTQTERIAELPGVEAVALSSSMPLSPAGFSRPVNVAGRPAPNDPRERLQAGIRRVSPGYAEVMRLPLRAGRFFTALDGAGSPRVVVVSESFAREAFGGEPALGQRLTLPDRPLPITGRNDGTDDSDVETWEVVGVVGDVRFPSRRGPFRPDSAGDIYLTLLQPPPERSTGLPEDAPTIEAASIGNIRIGRHQLPPRATVESDVDQDVRVEQHQRVLPGERLVSRVIPPCRLEPAPPPRRERGPVLHRKRSERGFDERRQRHAARTRVLLGSEKQVAIHRNRPVSSSSLTTASSTRISHIKHVSASDRLDGRSDAAEVNGGAVSSCRPAWGSRQPAGR